jgi:hypothetical protein
MPQPHDPKPGRPPPERRKAAHKASPDTTRYPEESRNFDTDMPPGGHMGSAGDPAEGKRD